MEANNNGGASTGSQLADALRNYLRQAQAETDIRKKIVFAHQGLETAGKLRALAGRPHPRSAEWQRLITLENDLQQIKLCNGQALGRLCLQRIDEQGDVATAVRDQLAQFIKHNGLTMQELGLDAPEFRSLSP